MTSKDTIEQETTFYDESEAFDPLILFEYDHDPGNYCLMLSDNHMVEHCHLFEVRGFQGGGYDWEAVARQCVRAHAPEIEGLFGYDPEAGTFVAYGKDLKALQTLARLMSDAHADEEKLRLLIMNADEGWFD